MKLRSTGRADGSIISNGDDLIAAGIRMKGVDLIEKVIKRHSRPVAGYQRGANPIMRDHRRHQNIRGGLELPHDDLVYEREVSGPYLRYEGSDFPVAAESRLLVTRVAEIGWARREFHRLLRVEVADEYVTGELLIGWIDHLW